MREQPRIPTLLALLILICGLSALVYLVENISQLIIRAGGNTKPRAVTVANIADENFTVSWLTDVPTIGFIEYKEEQLLSFPKIAFDVRDDNFKNTPRSTHFVTVNGVKPNTQYVVTLTSGGKTQIKLQVATGPTLSAPQLVKNPAFGILLDKRDDPVSEGIALASFSDSQTLSSLIGSDGSWILPIGLIRANDLQRYFEPETKDKERLFFETPEGESTVITNLNNDSPLPKIRLGESYDLTKFESQKNSGLIIAQAQNFSNITGKVNGAFEIFLPRQNSSIPSGKPAFKGIGIAGKRVIITINSPHTALVGKTTVSANGNWSWTPNDTLIPDRYTSTVTSFDDKDIPITKTVSFTTLKSGTSVLGEATTSASFIPSPLPSATPIISPSPAQSSSPSATPFTEPPVTGTWEPTLILFFIGISLLFLGSIPLIKNIH